MVDAKSRLLAKARKLGKDIERYASWGYVTEMSDYVSDDQKLSRGIDSLYDLARKNELGEDAELQQVRMQLRERYVHVRNNEAPAARRQMGEANTRRIDREIADKRLKASGMQGYFDEMKIGEAKRGSRRRGG